MKIRTTLMTLSLLLVFSSVTAFPQQPGSANSAGSASPMVPTEKKRAMNKFDPVDIFPEAKERGRKERNKRNQNPEQSSILANNSASAVSESVKSAHGRRRSRRNRNSTARAGDSEAALAVNTSTAQMSVVSAVTAPTPATTPTTLPSTSNTAEPTPNPGTPTSAMLGSAAALTTPPSQPLVATNKPPSLPAAATNSSNSFGNSLPKGLGLSLPVILTLISVVLLALIIALARLMKQFRKPVN